MAGKLPKPAGTDGLVWGWGSTGHTEGEQGTRAPDGGCEATGGAAAKAARPVTAQRAGTSQRHADSERMREKQEKRAANSKMPAVCSRREHLKEWISSFARGFFQPGRNEAVIASIRSFERKAAASCYAMG